MAEQDNTFLSADNIYEDVEGETGKTLNLEANQQSNLLGLIKSRFAAAEDKRDLDEKRWLTSYENYRGLYSKGVKFRSSEKSRVFIKVTKTKVLAAFGQLVDVIFGTGKFPIGVTETKIPEGELGDAHLNTANPAPDIETSMPDNIGNRMEDDPQENPYDIGYEGDGRTLKAGATFGKGMFEETFEDQLISSENSLPLLTETSQPGYYTSLTPGFARNLFPNSLPNMRDRTGTNLGQEFDFRLLPGWMTSQQANGSTLGYTPAWVIAYCKPGTADTIKNNIETLWVDPLGTPYTLNTINFQLDRITENHYRR